MLRKSLGVAGLAIAVGAMFATPSQAAMMGQGLDSPAGAPLTQKAQIYLAVPNPLDLFAFGGHDYCWYDGGWRGPGWYWCGYGGRQGYGWGGGEGFNGWTSHRYERDWHGHGGGGHFDHHEHEEHHEHFDHHEHEEHHEHHEEHHEHHEEHHGGGDHHHHP